jgi:hypothetical protein
MWLIGWTDEFERWIVSRDVDAAARQDIRAALLVLREFGPQLGRPLVDTIKGSRHANQGIAGAEQGPTVPHSVCI